MKGNWHKALSLTMAAILAVAPVRGMDFSTYAEETTGTQITDEEMEALLEGDTDSAVTVRTRQAVHDPSIVATDDGYYVFGSHMGVAKTSNLMNWTSVTSESESSTLFGDVNGNVISYNEAFKENAYQGTVNVTTADGDTVELDFGTYDASAWIADNTVSGNMWAPDVIYNTTMNKWCMYLSLNGANWNSTIVLLTSDSIEGPYVYQGPVVFTGFSTADSDNSFHDTDLELVLGELDELPEKYNQRADTSNGTWGEWWPHAIDPTVFYDDDGNLWIAYGSWSGGICMLELDENTGLRDYTVTYASDSDTLGKSYTSDAYFGKRIAGGYYVSGEGPYIQKIGDYYYLFMSYGFYSPEGGYNMRIFRSKNPDGPYVDSEGNSACYTGYVHNYNGSDNRGERLMAGYKWDTMDVAEVAQGHNSAFVDKDGKAYVVYHTKFADGTVSHALRVHQLFVNEDGWLVAAPYEYDGETLSDTGYSTEQVAGEYDTILHAYVQDYANLDYATPKQITLNADGTITGTYSGTWTIDSDSPNIRLSFDGHTYKGVLIEQKVDNESYSTLCFTAVNEEGLCIWGSMSSDAKSIIAQNVKNFDFGVPQSTYTDFTLPTEGNSGAAISWISSNPDVLTADGKLASKVTEDVEVTLTARISKGGYYYDKAFKVVVKAGDGTFTERTKIASYFENDPQDLSVTMDGSLFVANPFYQGTTSGIDISGGVSVEFDIEKTGDIHALGTILAFMGSGRLYFTPASYMGYNATGGYFDANVNNYSLVEDYIGDSAHVKLEFTPDGFAVYVNGELAYDESIVSTENGGASLTDYSKVLTWLNQSADILYFGYGSWWSSAGYDEANCKISNVECYVEKTLDASSKEKNAVVWYEKDSVTYETNDSITYDENPFYGVATDDLYLAYTINFASDAAKNGWDGVLSFYNSTSGGRISIQTNPYVCFNDGNGSWLDLNNPSTTNGTNWAASAETGKDYRVEIEITRTGAVVKIDGEEISTSLSKANSSTDYGTLLDYISGCDKLTWGVGQAVTSYWWTELCTISDVVIASSSNLVKLAEEEVTITSNDYIDTRENPFYGKDLLGLDLDYTLNFASDAAKNGWDGIFSFFQSASGGRVSMQTNPYLSFNNGSGTWWDINNPNNANSGGTNWAASAETGKDYQVSVKIRKDGVSISIDGEKIALSSAASGDVTGEDVLSFISACDQFTFGVGKAATSYWWTELSTIKNFTAKAVCKSSTDTGSSDDSSDEEETEESVTALSENSWQILKNDGILYLDNPVADEKLNQLEISYDILFADDAAKNGWDGLFSFYNTQTAGRVSIQSAPYLCFNDMNGDDVCWADINSPSLDGSTDWAADAKTGKTYHIDITVTKDAVEMKVDGESISIAQNTSDNFDSYQKVLDMISGCDKLTIGVGLAETSFWNTELCTISNLSIVANAKDETDAGDDSDTGNEGSTEDTGSDSDTGNEGSTGDTGSDSDTGNEGNTEDTGSDSNTGNEGNTEDTGSDSSTGDTGNESSTGNDSNSGNNSSTGKDKDKHTGKDKDKENNSDKNQSNGNQENISGTITAEPNRQEDTYRGPDGKDMRRIKNKKYDSVSISGEAGVFPSGADFDMCRLTEGDQFNHAREAVNNQLKSCNTFAVMEIDLFDAQNTAIHQLDGYVSVTMPLPDGITVKDGKSITVYRLGDDGSLTRCDTTVNNGTVTFSTNHFSTFIFAEQDTSAVAPDTSDRGSFFIVGAVVLLLLGAGTVIAAAKKRRVCV